MSVDRKLNARKAVDFLQSSELVALDMPLARVVANVSKLDEVAGYVIAWEDYVLVVASDIKQELVQPVAKQ